VISFEPLPGMDVWKGMVTDLYEVAPDLLSF